MMFRCIKCHVRRCKIKFHLLIMNDRESEKLILKCMNENSNLNFTTTAQVNLIWIQLKYVFVSLLFCILI